ncbi:MAG: hypothetical protein ACRDZX_01965 [Acidimicrobiales bacterium]
MDTLEIIRQMEADPALLARVRAVVLSEELLQLPQRLAGTDARLAARLDELEVRVAEMDSRLSARLETLSARLEALANHLETFVAATDLRFEGVEHRLELIERRLGNLEDGVGRLKGYALEHRVRDQPRRYLSRLIRGAALANLDELVVAGTLEEADEAVWRLDAVVRGELRSTGAEILCAVEVPWRAHSDDLSRAVQRGALLARLASSPTLPLVLSEQGPGPAVTQKALELGVALVVATSLAPLVEGRLIAPPER